MNSAIHARLSGWRKRRGVVLAETGFPYLFLAVLAATSFTARGLRGTELLVDISLCALTAAWMLGMYTLNPAWRRRTRHMAVFVAGLLVLVTILVLRDSWFGFLIAVCFAFAREALPWPWPMYVGGGLGVVGALSQTEDSQIPLPLHALTFTVALAIDVLLFSTFMWLIHEREQQIEQHKESLAELSEVNRRLEATIAENEDLHQQLVIQAREAGVLDERRRMAREIHDTLAQGLTGIVTQLQAAEQAASRTPGEQPGWQRHVAAATQLARESLTEARRSVDALRPEPLEGCRLSEALSDVAERWSALNGIPVQVTTTGTARPVDPEAEFALLRAAQEALANVARHAHASRVGVTISYMENEVALDVRDDGVGFDPVLIDHGFGLVAMRQRIAALSGTLQIEAEPGGGTAISACVPTVSALASS
ncbi:MAG TPA: sensor histidine kinase [Trebonia sp.]|jgi:signal transduction histidine kinase|nr:sensor histidine kinase [Trebonia sp.]